MSIALPARPAPSNMTIGVVSVDNMLSPEFGGDDQEILRKGSRYALAYQMPPMRYETSMEWGRRLRAKGQTVVMKVHQPGFDVGVPGSPLVKGAGQAGSSLLVDGLTPNYIIREGQALSVVTDGQLFVYFAADTIVADADGEATVPLETMLRRPPADNDSVKIADPEIEGFVREFSQVEVGVDQLVRLQFTIRERE